MKIPSKMRAGPEGSKYDDPAPRNAGGYNEFMGRKVYCRHCHSPEVVRAGMAEIRRISGITNKPYGRKKVFLVYKCRACLKYTPCGDLENLVS